MNWSIRWTFVASSSRCTVTGHRPSPPQRRVKSAGRTASGPRRVGVGRGPRVSSPVWRAWGGRPGRDTRRGRLMVGHENTVAPCTNRRLWHPFMQDRRRRSVPRVGRAGSRPRIRDERLLIWTSGRPVRRLRRRPPRLSTQTSNPTPAPGSRPYRLDSLANIGLGVRRCAVVVVVRCRRPHSRWPGCGSGQTVPRMSQKRRDAYCG